MALPTVLQHLTLPVIGSPMFIASGPTLVAAQCKAGIVLPDTAKEKPQKGKVLAVGDGKLDDNGQRVPLDVSEGDEVLYSKYGGTEIKVDGEELLVLRESDVLAKVQG